MKTHYIAIMVFCSLLAACTAAEPEILSPSEGGQDVPSVAEGMRVVDYSVAGGLHSKALGENLPANERISSLKYLLYDSAGKLEKERDIPGIGRETVWPLTRENMSWEQREALKDTLSQSRSYTAVFIANADPSLFGLDGSSDEQSVLHSYDDFGSACLSLPPVAFGDNNMFYLSVSKIQPGDEDVTSCDVLLERIVSRTDISRINPDVEYSGAENDGAWGAYLESLVENSLYPSAKGDEDSGIFGSIMEFMDDFSRDFSNRAFLDIPDDPSYSTFASSMRETAVSEAVLDAVRQQILDWYFNECKDNADMRDRMQTWKDATVSFTLGNPASEFMIEDMTPRTVQGYSFEYVADGNGTVSVAGFGDATGSFNTLSSIAVSESSGTGVSFNVPAGFFFWHGMNVRNSAVCNPLSSVTVSGIRKTVPVTLSLSMEDILVNGVLSGQWKEAYRQVFEAVMSDKGYGSLAAFSLACYIPSAEASNLVLSASIE